MKFVLLEVNRNSSSVSGRRSGQIDVSSFAKEEPAHRSGCRLQTYGAAGAPERAAYCASKGAIHNLVESLAVEWGQIGIRVNAVAPTGVRTPMVQALIDAGTYNLAGVKARAPLGRLAEPEEIADACWFLASDQAAMITGTV